MKRILSVLSLLLVSVSTLHSSSALAESQQCPVVNCDCGAFQEAKWRGICVAREAQVVQDCVANQGQPKSFCGLHGPAAFPLALSARQPLEASIAGVSVDQLMSLVATQEWSLDDSFQSLQVREQAKQFVQTGQIISLLKQDLNRLQQLYMAVLPQSSAKQVSQYVQRYAGHSTRLRSYATQLWQKAPTTANSEEQLAYRDLAFKVARLAGDSFELNGDLSGLAQRTAEAAAAWQASADVSKNILAWEMSVENRATHIAFYQAQMAARWHRATYHWLATQNAASVLAAYQHAMDAAEGRGLMADAGEDHVDIRAIKEGSN
jgi:hypothetical protein